ncbi:uncharacterized protein N7477_001600 [Penicillium maclennaniae]|uniref:uncharacterized protein n=1 Tax=Penicillium maclennaniae TaxID=1343394 RepID=UPI002541B6EC|nr:uncharacterized protein N7477_001600 [Penicillium maclennaniae]KAJ5681660.1 hypothetical protein N7477_001600 [Penicillium maclennaniae]
MDESKKRSEQRTDEMAREISDFEYDYVIVRQNIASVNVGGAYEVSLAWSMSTNTSSDAASCLLEVAVDSTTILETGASASGVRPVSGSWETATATYTPTASTGIPFVISISCSEGQSSDSPIIGLADISMVSSSCYTSTLGVASSTSSMTSATSNDSPVTSPTSSSAIAATTAGPSTGSGNNLVTTDGISTMTSSDITGSSSDIPVWSSAISTTASSTTSATWTASTGTSVSGDDGTTTLTASTTDGDSLSASVPIDTSDLSSAVSGTVSVSDTTSKRKRTVAPSCTLYVSQNSEVISTTVVDAGSSAQFSACLAAKSSGSVELLAVCSGPGATIEVSGLTVGSASSAAEDCAASTSATSSPIASPSTPFPHRSGSSTSLGRTPVHTKSARPSKFASACRSRSSVRIPTSQASPTGSDSASDSGEYTTSTVFSTRTATTTACPSNVVNCPAHEKTTYVTTETVVVSTTVCPVTAEATGTVSNHPYVSTETIYTTRTSTIYECPATVTNCPEREKTTSATTETLVAGTIVYTVNPSSSSSGSGSDSTISGEYNTENIGSVTFHTTISPVTVTETLVTASTRLAGSFASESTSDTSALHSTNSAISTVSIGNSQISSGTAPSGLINTLFSPSTSSPNSPATEIEGSTSTLFSTADTAFTTDAGSTLATATKATGAASVKDMTSEVNSSKATGAQALQVSSTSFLSSFTTATTDAGSGQVSLASSTSTAATETGSAIATSAPLFNGALLAFSPSLTGVIGLVIAFFL